VRKVRGTSSSRVTGSHDAEVTRWAGARLRYVDNLKVILIAAIIIGHAVSGYGELDWWAYADQRETTLSPITQAIVLAVGGPFAMLLIPVLFLVAGLMTPPSLARKHPGPYVRDRLLRLGVVFAVYVLVLLPLTMYVLEYWIGTDTGSYWSSYFGAEKTLDTGTLWFVGDLLLFSSCWSCLPSLCAPYRCRLNSRPWLSRREASFCASGWPGYSSPGSPACPGFSDGCPL